jgi:hypothetical protein
VERIQPVVTISFETDIKPLFREEDRIAMDYVFDLWLYDDVKTEADNILERVVDGTMPCDEPWAEERIQLFRDWIEGGLQP